MEFFIAASILAFALFYLAWKLNPTRLLCGWLFCAFLVVGGITAVLLTVQLGITWLMWIILGVGMLVLLLLFFGIYLLILFLLLNFRLMFKRERHSLQNSLTLLWALMLIVYAVLSTVLGMWQLPYWAGLLWAGITALIIFSLVHMFVFLVTFILCNMVRPRKNQQYIIVLGSGLIGGEVPPLLAGRINRAIHFYKRQAKKHTPPKLVMSGGHGDDERRPEGEAMRDYAIQQGVPQADILVEDKSANTAQNMAFSWRLIEQDSNESQPKKILYATSNYHVLRAGIYARSVGLKIRGLGAKTALYYLPSALLREYLALWSMHKVRTGVTAAVIFLLGMGIYAMPELLNWLIRLLQF